MKKLFMALLCAVGVSSAAFAAGGDMALGVQMSHASSANQLGLGVKFQCELVDAFRIEPSFNYYFENANWSAWDVNVNLHYVINVVNKFDVYPLAGIGYSNWKRIWAPTPPIIKTASRSISVRALSLTSQIA